MWDVKSLENACFNVSDVFKINVSFLWHILTLMTIDKFGTFVNDKLLKNYLSGINFL